MQERQYNAIEAWLGLKLKLDPSQLEVAGGMPAWVHYRHPQINGQIVVHQDHLYAEGKSFFDCGFDSQDFKAFQCGFYGKKPFPRDEKGKSMYSKGIEADVQATVERPLMVI